MKTNILFYVLSYKNTILLLLLFQVIRLERKIWDVLEKERVDNTRV